MIGELSEVTCPSCGLPMKIEHSIKINEFFLCLECTLGGTQEPNFEINVYAVAIGYFMNKKQIKDPLNALYRAYIFVSQLPYWGDQIHPPPPLEGLINASMLLSTEKESFIAREEEDLSEIFISYSLVDPGQNLIGELASILKIHGYRILYKEKCEITGSQKHSEAMKLKEQIAQVDFCVPILSKSYFASDLCKVELENLLAIKDPKSMFPVWWKDMDSGFLKKQANKGEKILDIVGVGWNEWQGNINNLAQKLVNLIQAAQGLQTYANIELIANEVQIIKELEKLVGIPLPSLNKEDLESAEFGFYAEKNQIRALFLVRKKLTYLPSNLGECMALERLNLSYNDLHMLPTSFEQLQHLEKLNIVSNPLQALPPSFQTVHKHFLPQYPNVTEREAEFLALLELLLGKPILQVNEIKIDTFGYTVDGNHVIGLGLHNQELNSIPLNIGNLIHLNTLIISQNKLVFLPETIGNLQNLQELDLNFNQLASLPESIGNLINLRSLNLEINRLSMLPESIGDLMNLQTLNIGDNQIYSLPESIGNLKSLKNLYVNQNKMITLPESFLQLTKLQEIRLDYAFDVQAIDESCSFTWYLHPKFDKALFEALVEFFRNLREKGCKMSGVEDL